MKKCPTRDDLGQFMSCVSPLDVEERKEISLHVIGCVPCKKVMIAIAQEREDLTFKQFERIEVEEDAVHSKEKRTQSGTSRKWKEGKTNA